MVPMQMADEYGIYLRGAEANLGKPPRGTVADINQNVLPARDKQVCRLRSGRTRHRACNSAQCHPAAIVEAFLDNGLIRAVILSVDRDAHERNRT